MVHRHTVVYPVSGHNVFCKIGWKRWARCMACKSPDLTPMDFFFWGHTKDQVYRTWVTYLQDLKKRIVHYMEGIKPRMCCNSFRAFEYRVDIVRAIKWAQVEVQWNGERWGKTFWVAVSCGENCTLPALFIISTKCLKRVHSFSEALCFNKCNIFLRYWISTPLL
jgi:hypothetical protein